MTSRSLKAAKKFKMKKEFVNLLTVPGVGLILGRWVHGAEETANHEKIKDKRTEGQDG